MTSSSKKAMTWATVAAAVAGALLVAVTGAGWPERLAHDGRSVMRQIGLAPPRATDRQDPPTASSVRDPATRRTQQ